MTDKDKEIRIRLNMFGFTRHLKIKGDKPKGFYRMHISKTEMVFCGQTPPPSLQGEKIIITFGLTRIKKISKNEILAIYDLTKWEYSKGD